MEGRLFEDLVVSSPASRVGRRAAVLPLSAAVHAAVVALALLFPLLRPDELPAPPALDIMRWPTPVRAATPPQRHEDRASRPESRPRPAPSNTAPVVADPPPAPGPSVWVDEPSTPPTSGDVPSPCLTGCDPVPQPGGSGDGRSAESPGGPGPSETGNGATRVGGKIEPPTRVAYVPPAYPEIARQARIGGVVVLDCTIDQDGRVVDVRVISGHPLLNEAALSAVRQWRYRPTRLNGVPIPVLMTVTVRFTPRT
jgi:protein TonB